jgi:hypothetical protein
LSLARLVAVTLKGWRRHQNHAERRVRDRFAREVFPLRSAYAGAVWAMRKWYQGNERLGGKMDVLLKTIYAEFGWKTRMVAPLVGRYVYRSLKKEEARLASGWAYEPVCTCEKNAAALALENRKPSSVKVPVKKVTWVSGSPLPAMAKSV